MALLSNPQKAAIRYHYRVSNGLNIPRVLEDCLNKDFLDEEIFLIDNLISRCDSAYSKSSLPGGDLILDKNESTDQDISFTTVRNPSSISAGSTTTSHYGDRHKLTYKRDGYNKRRSAYHNEALDLIRSIGYEGF